MDDALLVARAKDGDISCAETLLSRHQNGAYTAALRLLGEPADAEDVAQDAMVRAYARLADLEDGTNFGAWLRKIAVNLSLNFLRRRRQFRFESLEDGAAATDADLVDERGPTPEKAALDMSARDEIERLIRKLPVDQRVAVVLRDMYDYDVAEVAELQRCGLSAVKMRIARGRAQLKKMILEARPASAESLA